jgi:hypothetical protein
MAAIVAEILLHHRRILGTPGTKQSSGAVDPYRFRKLDLTLQSSRGLVSLRAFAVGFRPRSFTWAEQPALMKHLVGSTSR